MGNSSGNLIILCNFIYEKEIYVQTVIYVILKRQNGGLILDANRSFWDMMKPHISSIQRCQCGSDILTEI